MEESSKQDSSVSRGSLAPLVWDWGPWKRGYSEFSGKLELGKWEVGEGQGLHGSGRAHCC